MIAAATLAASLALHPSAPAEAEFAMACISHAEWEDITNGLTVPQVQAIADGDGHEGETKPGHFGIWWPLCWRSDKVGIVWFANLTQLVDDKNIINPP